jgi:hypothetical protein
MKDKSHFWPVLTEAFLYDEKLQFYGTLDRMDVNEKGEAEIIDYKMGKFHKWLESKYRFEMMGYKHLVMTSREQLKTQGVEFKTVKFGVLVFLGDDQPVTWPQELKPITERAFYAKVPRIREHITGCHETEEWDKKATPLCSWCPFFGLACTQDQVGRA